jgi:hypothetical protein
MPVRQTFPKFDILMDTHAMAIVTALHVHRVNIAQYTDFRLKFV